jgi:AcrR family transcriptional regulator
VSPATSAKRTLSTAEERREAVIEAAIPVFAERGFRAASTVEIAAGAGISQAYLFRLFPTKVDLFVAVCGASRARLLDAFRRAAEERSAEDTPMHAMACAYRDLLESDRTLLMLQLQSQVTSGEPAIAASMQQTFRELYALVEEGTGASEEETRAFFAQGMLMNVMAAINALELDEAWAQALSSKDGDPA